MLLSKPYSSSTYLAALVVLALFIGLVWKIKLAVRFSPLWAINGPQPASFLFGDVPAIMESPSGVWGARNAEVYGPTFLYTGILGEAKLYTADPKVLDHLMSDPIKFTKPKELRLALTRLLGNGVITAEDDVHKRQRKTLAPAFSTASLKPLLPIFLSKAKELKDVLLKEQKEADKLKAVVREEDGLVNVFLWVNRATLDSIGLAGFDYDFSALQNKENELAEAFKTMFEPSLSSFRFQTLVPALLGSINIVSNKRVESSLAVVKRIGKDIIRRKKELLQPTDGEKEVQKSDVLGKDLISMLVRANLASDLSSSQRLSDAEVLAQVSTFVAAGHESTTGALTFTLQLLADHPSAQAKLHAELSTIDDEKPNWETLNGLTYLNAVVKESLRVSPPVPGTMRVVAEEDFIPLGVPIVGRDGKEMSEIRVPKGTTIYPSLLGTNLSESIWGETAREFRPERWLDTLPKSISTAPEGPLAHLATFSSGPRACLGWRFAIFEIKAFLFVLVRSIRFESPVPALEYVRQAGIVQRPFVKGREGDGPQLRLKVTAV